MQGKEKKLLILILGLLFLSCNQKCPNFCLCEKHSYEIKIEDLIESQNLTHEQKEKIIEVYYDMKWNQENFDFID